MGDERVPAGSDAATVLAGAVDALPEGRIAQQLASGSQLRVKFGMDPTSPDIHLGHCVLLQKLRAFQDLGHIVVLIVGDYTARVGDPSGRDGTRPVLSDEEIAHNAQTYQDQAFKVLDRSRTEVRSNSEWLDMPSGDFYDVIRRFNVARLIERDDFQRRMEASKPISALELMYPVLQGYDSVAIEADIELGATDQKFNLLFGRDVQEAYGQAPQSILTMPILVGLDGTRKMSKSYGNYVGVTDAPDDMFGKLMSIPDEVMGSYYMLLLSRELDAGLHPNEAKRALGRELVTRFHDAGAAAEAESRFDSVHRRGEIPDDIPDVELTPGNDGEGAVVHLPALISRAFGVSSSEARRLVAQGGVRLDSTPLAPDTLDLPDVELRGRVMQVGKRRFARLV